MDTHHLLSVLRQLPASIVFKKAGAEETYVSEGFIAMFDLPTKLCNGPQNVTFSDLVTHARLDACSCPLSLSERGEEVHEWFDLNIDKNLLRCFVQGKKISTDCGDWIVLLLTNDHDAVSSSVAKGSMVNKHITFNQLLSRFSSKLINADVLELDGIIDQSLAAFGEFCDVDRCYLFEFSEDEAYMSNTHEWVAPGVMPFIDELQDLPTQDMPFFMSHISSGIFKLDNVASIPDFAASERELFQGQRIFSMLCVRIMAGGKRYGFIGCDIIGAPYSWKPHDIEYLTRIGEMLGNTLQNLNNRKSLHKIQIELLSANRQLERLANIDGLTGIANRRLFDTTLAADLVRCREFKQPLSLMLIDVDHFKLYNDTHGHVAGDNVLKRLADTFVLGCQGNDDLVARYGGEEFAIILPNTPREALESIASRILSSVKNLAILHRASNHAQSLTISIGMVCIDDWPQANCKLVAESVNATSFIDQADKALYRAKQSGRNCAKF